MRLKHAMQTQRRKSLHIGKTHDQHLEAFAEAFSPARQGTILNSHRVIGIATNTDCCTSRSVSPTILRLLTASL